MRARLALSIALCCLHLAACVESRNEAVFYAFSDDNVKLHLYDWKKVRPPLRVERGGVVVVGSGSVAVLRFDVQGLSPEFLQRTPGKSIYSDSEHIYYRLEAEKLLVNSNRLYAGQGTEMFITEVVGNVFYCADKRLVEAMKERNSMMSIGRLVGGSRDENSRGPAGQPESTR